MRLYHGGLVVVESPRILHPNRTLDYGSGFYTTSSQSQAEQWVIRKLNHENPVGYVSEYEWNEEEAHKLDFLYFSAPDDDWIAFVHSNRTGRSFEHWHDIVYGPVANDKVYAAFSLYEQGFLDKDGLMRELRAYKLVDQVLFHTERSLATLRYVRNIQVMR